MSRTRAERRHHEWRLKAIRKHYHNVQSATAVYRGKVYLTPCQCSCWMCGHQRKFHGMNIQERKARLRNTD